jgi:hypothetical protein
MQHKGIILVGLISTSMSHDAINQPKKANTVQNHVNISASPFLDSCEMPGSTSLF